MNPATRPHPRAFQLERGRCRHAPAHRVLPNRRFADRDVAELESAVATPNARRPDFILVCGDLKQRAAHDRAWDDFLRIQSQLAMPCSCAVGNHDAGNVPTAASLAR